MTISFIGQQCCGPHDVYFAMAFIAGILAKLFLSYGVYWAWKTGKRMHTSYVIINHLKDIRRDKEKLEGDQTLLMARIVEQQEDLKVIFESIRNDQKLISLKYSI